MPSPDSIHDQSAWSVVESGRTEKSKLAHVDGNPQRSDAADPSYDIVHVPFGLSVRFRTALVLTPYWSHRRQPSTSIAKRLGKCSWPIPSAGISSWPAPFSSERAPKPDMPYFSTGYCTRRGVHTRRSAFDTVSRP
ncbi:hypothetical protein CWR43_35490 [Rhizobium sullae]|uniref:Uncharacterized protein n=1 Tax=Rhizobium sullae TaxID=50338 RepID=A0A2N0CYE6_RHISU|nr:hypothetical protein CWR43_35490 [Rhizobium sullae]